MTFSFQNSFPTAMLNGHISVSIIVNYPSPRGLSPSWGHQGWFWFLGIVRNPLSLKTSRRNTQGLSQPPAHLLKSEFTSYFRVAHSENNTWRCCWAPSSSQQELNLQSQHAWGYLKAVSSSWWLCPIAAASSTEALVKTPAFAEPAWFPSLLQYNYSCCNFGCSVSPNCISSHP